MSPNSFQKSLNSADFLRSLRKLGVQKTKGKQLPLALFNIDANNIKLFLTRYLSLDGYVNHQGQFEVISKELIPENILEKVPNLVWLIIGDGPKKDEIIKDGIRIRILPAWDYLLTNDT